MIKQTSSTFLESFGRTIMVAGISLVAVCAALAEPVTYTGFTITDGKLGNWSFHNARVYLTFQSDTTNVQFMQFPDPCNPPLGTVDVWINQTGKASVTIISGQKAVTANFVDGQIFVSVDLGNTPGPGDPPHMGARGIGFGSITSTGIEPTYPLSLEDGTVDWGDIVNDGFGGGDGAPSLELQGLYTDLVHNTGFSGRGWACVGFLNRFTNGGCAPANALHTDHGDLYLYMPYAEAFHFDSGVDSLNAGFFLVQVGESNQANVSAPAPVSAAPTTTSAHPITYHGYLISDVTLGENHYTGAQVYLSFNSDTSNVVPFSSGHGFRNTTGTARVTIVSGQQVTSADFDSGQIYVYYDIDHASIGFGSIARNGSTQSGYPLSITANKDNDGMVENSSVGAVSDLTLTPADAANFTAGTAGLKTNLKNTTLMSGGVSSCLGFDPATSTCTSLTPVPLKTNHGDFLLFEPYRHDAVAAGQVTYSVNWGVFWAEAGAAREE
jgi:hypothetical protein